MTCCYCGRDDGHTTAHCPWRENAQLRVRLLQGESLLAVARETNVVLAARVQLLERLALALNADSTARPLQPLAHWVKTGPHAVLLASLMKP
ncbi:hypothetical protein [Cupriavidus basilensis]